VPLSDWDCAERIDTGLSPFELGGVKLRPILARYRGVTVTGRDWIPIQGDKAALAVHTPEIYFRKQAVHRGRSFSLVKQGPDAVVANLGRTRVLRGVAVLVGGQPNYYHWLVDHLARLLLARRLLGQLPTVLVHEPTASQRDMLDRLGVAHWEPVSADESVVCEDLWIVDGLARMTVAHPEVPRLLREAFPPSSGPLGTRNSYLSRGDASSRRIVNERDVLDALPGFEMHLTGEMNIQDQVDLFFGSRCYVAAHGAGMTNSVFCRPGSRVVEIFTPLHKASSMQILAMVSGLKHAFAPARNVSVGANGDPLLGDWEVDIGACVRWSSAATEMRAARRAVPSHCRPARSFHVTDGDGGSHWKGRGLASLASHSAKKSRDTGFLNSRSRAAT
jgi:capsular polysaccharide biosynthesis protein